MTDHKRRTKKAIDILKTLEGRAFKSKYISKVTLKLSLFRILLENYPEFYDPEAIE